ncbi:ester cyclase [Geodermatophilus sp. YIM 151500]|uniref:ester cyclase n=1 Tax=Geodermatophilus sp. YIM 151500 TaxID=2984531 RepID=UPI0021E4F435|nr:ester cyclase [Geodermatophilus sp. YIM 151500]MCV2491328.1 ester cyclase [Geodermatophilus sp. YIM 151500]
MSATTSRVTTDRATAGSATAGSATADSTTAHGATANRALVLRFIRDYQEGGDERVLQEVVSPSLVNHTPMVPDPPGGPAEVKAIFDGLHAALTGFSVEVRHQVADDDLVMTHKVFKGRHTGELFGLPPTGRHVRFAVMDVVRIADGRIVEHWGLVDLPALQAQLAPEPTPAPTP